MFGSLVRLTSGAELDNAADGRVIIAGDTDISPAGGATGATFVNAGLVDKDGGSGTARIDTPLDNTGTVIAGSGVLDIGGAVTGAGVFNINAGDSLEFGSTVAAGSRVNMLGTDTTLILNGGSNNFSAAVTGFGAGDTIDVRSVPPEAKISYSSKDHYLVLTGAKSQVAILLLGQYSAAGFSLSGNGQGGSDISYTAPASPALATALTHGR